MRRLSLMVGSVMLWGGLIALSPAFPMSPVPADVALAHTDVEIDEWVDDWVRKVAESPALTVEMLEEYLEFVRAHQCQILGQECVMERRSAVEPPQSTQPSQPSSPHPYPSSPTPLDQWAPLVATYFPAEQVDRALRVMWCESKGDPNAVNPRSGAAGLFQHLPKYWGERSEKAGWGGADIFDPTANVAVAAWLWRTGGWGHWTCR